MTTISQVTKISLQVTFQAFYNLKQKFTSLGVLALVQKLLAKHGSENTSINTIDKPTYISKFS